MPADHLFLVPVEDTPVLECRLCDKVIPGASKALEDTILYSNEHVLCIPALGALVPGYVIVTTKRHVTSVVDFSDMEVESLKQILHELIDLPIYQGGYLLFEHAAPNVDIGGGSRIHHYHLHFLPKGDLSLSAIEDQFSVSTKREIVTDIMSMRSRELNQGYVLLSDGSTTVCHLSDEIPSQFIRKIIAGYFGIAHQWNWQVHPHLDIVAQTIETVRTK